MQHFGALHVASLDGFAQLSDFARREIADGVHDTTRADGEHRKTEFLEPDKDTKVAAKAHETLCSEAQIVDSVFHTDEVWRAAAHLLNSVCGNRDCGSTGYVIDQHRQRRMLGDVDEVLDEASLWGLE